MFVHPIPLPPLVCIILVPRAVFVCTDPVRWFECRGVSVPVVGVMTRVVRLPTLCKLPRLVLVRSRFPVSRVVFPSRNRSPLLEVTLVTTRSGMKVRSSWSQC